MSPLYSYFKAVVAFRIVAIVAIANYLQAFCFDPFNSCSETQVVDLDRNW